MSFTLYLHLDYLHSLPGLRKGFRVIWEATTLTSLPCDPKSGRIALYLWAMLASTLVLVGFFVAPFRHSLCFGAKLSPCEELSLGAPGTISIFPATSLCWRILRSMIYNYLYECIIQILYGSREIRMEVHLAHRLRLLHFSGPALTVLCWGKAVLIHWSKAGKAVRVVEGWRGIYIYHKHTSPFHIIPLILFRSPAMSEEKIVRSRARREAAGPGELEPLPGGDPVEAEEKELPYGSPTGRTPTLTVRRPRSGAKKRRARLRAQPRAGPKEDEGGAEDQSETSSSPSGASFGSALQFPPAAIESQIEERIMGRVAEVVEVQIGRLAEMLTNAQFSAAATRPREASTPVVETPAESRLGPSRVFRVAMAGV